MRGIIGYARLCNILNSVLTEGLEILEYRDYNSAGVTVVHDGKVQVAKAKGKASFLKEKMEVVGLAGGQVGIAHTHWATHGESSEINSHPHQSGNTTLVHNSITENYNELKKELENAGHTFKSDTDSEVTCAYIDYRHFLKEDKQQILVCAHHHFRSSLAFAVIFADEADVIYVMRKNSPLILGTVSDEAFLVSDISAFLKYTNKYLLLKHEEIVRCSNEGIIIKTLDGDFVKCDIFMTDLGIKDVQKDGSEHFILKEIHEEPEVVKRAIDSLMQVDMEGLLNIMSNLVKRNDIHIVACGGAMYAGMITKSLTETGAQIHADCVCASEHRYANPVLADKALVILISQSGETTDTIAALQLVKGHGADTLAIVNVVGSIATREASFVIYTKAGLEIYVATTRAYCTQVAVLSLTACNLTYVHRNIDAEEATRATKELKNLPQHIQQLIDSDQYKAFAKKVYEHNDVLFIDRGLDYSLSMEGSLKLKEISCIHSETYAAGELKHGTVSLIEEGTPVIALATNEDLYEKAISNIKEAKVRGAYVVLLVSDDLDVASDYHDGVLVIPKVDKLTQGILTVILLQLMACKITRLCGCEIDQPRNPTKSVIVG